MTPTHFVEIEKPETWARSHLPSLQPIYGGEQAAIAYVRSKLSLSAAIPLKDKHIFRVRKHGANAGEWIYTAAG